MRVTPLEQLAYSLRYMHMLDDRPAGFDSELQLMLYKAGELSGMTQEQRRKYDIAMTTKLDILAKKAYARESGLEEGRAAGLEEGRAAGLEEGKAEGRAEGREMERIAIAKKLLDAGVDLKLICSVTGLSEKDIDGL